MGDEPRPRSFAQVDVFTAVPFKGNPVAVVLDSEGLSTAAMQQIANWTNLSETTFVVPATDARADYAVRIFTPRTELPFAGHPTLGTAHAVLEAGLATATDGQLVQQCAVGLVALTIGTVGNSFRLPRYVVSPASSPAIIAAALPGVVLSRAPMVVDVGPHWVVAEASDVDALAALKPDLAALEAYDIAHRTTGLTLYAIGGAGDITVRTFAPADGIAEDPVCGSGNGAVAAFRLHHGQVASGAHYRASQGRAVGRDGWIDIRIDGSDIHVGGSCVTCTRGELLA
jgi:PhzF family phenazine biosynthesis protein